MERMPGALSKLVVGHVLLGGANSGEAIEEGGVEGCAPCSAHLVVGAYGCGVGSVCGGAAPWRGGPVHGVMRPARWTRRWGLRLQRTVGLRLQHWRVALEQGGSPIHGVVRPARMDSAAGHVAAALALSWTQRTRR
jgi:hypothetical protein